MSTNINISTVGDLKEFLRTLTDDLPLSSNVSLRYDIYDLKMGGGVVIEINRHTTWGKARSEFRRRLIHKEFLKTNSQRIFSRYIVR